MKGGDIVVNTEKLRQCVDRSGVTYKHIAAILGITPQALRLKIKNQSEFTASEIVGLTDTLRLSRAEREEIFFAKQRG